MRSPVTVWIVALSVATLVGQISLAENTDPNAVRAIDFDFHGAPIWVAIKWLTRLTNQPVLIPVNVAGTFTYKSEHKLTRDEAVEAISSTLQANGWYLMNVDHSYYRLLPLSETNSPAVVPHIEIEIQADQLIVDGKSIQSKDLAQTIAPLIGPETEIWVRDTLDTTGMGSTPQFARILMPLNMAHPKRICTKLTP
jgi:type II secretory pathway component GspD/PulD (secretin)